MKPVQGGEPPRSVDGGPEGSSSPKQPRQSTDKSDDFAKRLPSLTDEPSAKEAPATEPQVPLTESPPQTPPQVDFSAAAGVLTGQASGPPLSVDASGKDTPLSESASAAKLQTGGRTSTSASGPPLSLVKTATASSGVASILSDAVQAISGHLSSDKDTDAQPSAGEQKPADLASSALPVAAETPETAQSPGVAFAAPRAVTSTSVGATPVATPSRTVTSLSAQIVSKLGDKITRFDVALDPAGLGRVNVSVEINAKGQMSARLAFEHPEAAAALSRESGALRQALHDAGFQMKPEDLTFQSDSDFSDRGAGTPSENGHRSGGRGNPFGPMTSLTDALDLSAMNAAAGRVAAGGLDIRI